VPFETLVGNIYPSVVECWLC